MLKPIKGWDDGSAKVVNVAGLRGFPLALAAQHGRLPRKQGQKGQLCLARWHIERPGPVHPWRVLDARVGYMKCQVGKTITAAALTVAGSCDIVSCMGKNS